MSTKHIPAPSRTAVLSAIMSLALPFAAAAAKTNYVNKSMSDYTGHDGSTPQLAYERLQTALDNASTGDTIIVAPGDYGADQGLGQKGIDKYPEDGSARGAARIRVPINKNLLIKSSGGASVTAIVGAHDPETTSGFGPNAVRCVDVEMDSSCSKQVIFEGFTFRDGATMDAKSQKGIAGAVYSSNNLEEPRNGSFSFGTYLVDCVVSNCIGAYKGQLTVGCTLVRCRLQDNAMPKGTAGTIDVCGYEKFVNCLVTRNRTVDPDTGETTTTTAYWNNNSRFLNCTFVDNMVYFYCRSTCYFLNCIDAMSRKNASDGSTGARFNDFSDSATAKYMVAPSLGDYRLCSGCAPATGGDSCAYTNKLYWKAPTVFKVDILKDIDGNSIDTNGTIAVGCSQSVVAPSAGALVGSDANVEFSDREMPQFSAAWVWPTAYPTNYTVSVRASGEGRIYSYLLDASGITDYGELASHTLFPTDYKNDTLLLRPHPSDAMTVGYRRATPDNADCRLVYLDAETTEADGSQDGSSAHPYRTIAQAASVVKYHCWAVFVAAPGDYDDGYGDTSINNKTVRGRLKLDDRGARLVAVEGPDTTAIVGAPDSGTLSTSDAGCGASAVGIAALKRADVAIQGFTLRDAYSGVDTYSKDGVVYSYEPDRTVVTDSVITNCRGKASVIAGARYVRCRITGNTGIDGFFAGNVRLVSSIVDDTTIESESGTYFANVSSVTPFTYGSTMVADGSHKVFVNISAGTFYNSIFAGGSAVSASAIAETFAGCVMSGFDSRPWTTGVTYTDNPMLLDTCGEDGNFRVFAGSAADGAATFSIDGLSGAIRQYANLDYAGNVRSSSVAGAYGEVCREGVYVWPGQGVAVAGGRIGYNAPSAQSVLTMGYAPGSSAPVAGYVVDGVTNLVSSATDAITVPLTPGEAHSVSPVYSRTWYVDDVNGSDSTGLGYNPACAFKTIPAALTNAMLATGDHVMVQPGVYDKETMTYESNVLRRRVVVPEKRITLESVCGPEVTFIKGEASDVMDEFASGSSQYNAGLGRNAVACVYLPANTVLRGFTLTNGYTRACTDEGVKRHGDHDYSGGGVCGQGRVENCVIANCKAFRGGGGYYSTFVKCEFRGNESIYCGGGTSDAKQYGCLFRGNVEHADNNAAGPFWWDALENCTVLDSAGGPRLASGVFKNDLILCPIGISGEAEKMSAANFVHCAVASDVGGYQTHPSYFLNVIPAGEGCILTNLAMLAVEPSGRPKVPSSLALDAGDPSVNSAYIDDADLSGVQRVMNGAMDIGALEGDWRRRYARDLNRSVVSVEEVSPEVVEAEGRVIRLVDGCSLSAALSFRPEAGPCEQRLIVEDGQLAVTIDGVETVYSSDAVLRISGGSSLTYAFSGSGSATLCSMKGGQGMTLIFR